MLLYDQGKTDEARALLSNSSACFIVEISLSTAIVLIGAPLSRNKCNTLYE